MTTKKAAAAADGQSLLIGGIIRTDKSKGYTGIPFLSSIPLRQDSFTVKQGRA